MPVASHGVSNLCQMAGIYVMIWLKLAGLHQLEHTGTLSLIYSCSIFWGALQNLCWCNFPTPVSVWESRPVLSGDITLQTSWRSPSSDFLMMELAQPPPPPKNITENILPVPSCYTQSRSLIKFMGQPKNTQLHKMLKHYVLQRVNGVRKNSPAHTISKGQSWRELSAGLPFMLPFHRDRAGRYVLHCL